MTSIRDCISDIWWPRTPIVGVQWSIQVDQNIEETPDRWVPASCFLCSYGCGLDIAVKDDVSGGQIVGVRAREDEIVNHGRSGPKGLDGCLNNSSADRLRQSTAQILIVPPADKCT